MYVNLARRCLGHDARGGVGGVTHCRVRGRRWSTNLSHDDISAVDAASNHLLGRMAGACEQLPWLMIVATRDAESGFAPSGSERLSLEPMDEASLRDLLFMATEAAPLRAHEMQLVLQRASGNPLFASEIIKAADDAIATASDRRH